MMKNKLAQKYLDGLEGSRSYPPLANCSAFIQGSGYNTERYMGGWYPNMKDFNLLVVIKEGVSQVWLPDDNGAEYASVYGLKECLKSREVFSKRVSFFETRAREMEKLYPSLSYDELQKKSWPELLSLVQTLRDLMWSANGPTFVTISIRKEMCLRVIQEEGFNLSAEALERIWDRATEAAFISFDKAQLVDILEMIVRGNQYKDIVEHCQYFGTDYYSAKDLASIERLLKEHYGEWLNNPEKARQTLELEKKNFTKVVEEHARWLATLTQEEKIVAEYLQTVMKIRDNRKNFFARSNTVIYRIAERMFQEVGLSRSLIPFYTMQELLKGEEYLRSVKESVKKRPAGFIVLSNYRGEPEMELCPVEEVMAELTEVYTLSHQEKGSNQIKGQTGCKGLVRGKVKIVIAAQAFAEFQEGDILVAGMTRPEYVPLMKKASAIITDEGGITCHAAIVSRELNKPCIIGTKIATKVLKDGEMVEVDAEKGVVRILKTT